MAPLTLVSTGDDWLLNAADDIRSTVLTQGAVLVRGLDIREPGDLAAVRESLGVQRYRATELFGQRTVYGDGVTSPIEWPAERELCPYQEETFSTIVPRITLTACVRPPETGGEACIADARELLRRLPDELVGRFRELGWTLTRVFHGEFGMDWREAFGLDSYDALTDLLSTIGIDHTRVSNGALRTVRRRPATVVHPETGEECWFNQAAFFNSASLEPRDLAVLRRVFGPDIPMETSYGDGSPLTAGEVSLINEAYTKISTVIPWQAGDLLVADNMLTAHGHRPYTGNPLFFTSLGAPVSLSL
ncbi:TauD/TfdA family dioxygenase [Streptomyces avicenniae]|uniref:TauD/TfdA family dioxygenase n=1 Tax=Streptomyces avicenniae TaxID=500153 RepID=UPI000699826B|nr:TauD/TfdA family dioxygenase [Streptomyces avicenniae]